MSGVFPDLVNLNSESNWQQLVEMERILNGDDEFLGLNEDQFVGGLMKSGTHTFFCDELQAVLNSGCVSQSQSESCYSVQRTFSSPPVGELAGNQRKRTAESLTGGADLKMEKKKMKLNEEDESSKFSGHTRSNGNSKSTTTAAHSCRKYPSASKSDSSSKGGDASNCDYIHVRARRGQATDSHSLAERVRREKISERMKFLQDLVPGCNKITGKAAMLDEIINYVQSLQRQVELLSMKLAAITPRLDHNMESNMPNEFYQPVLPAPEVNNSGVHFHMQPQVVQTPMGEQFSWGNDMQNPFVSSFLPQSFTGEGFTGMGNVKIELP